MRIAEAKAVGEMRFSALAINAVAFPGDHLFHSPNKASCPRDTTGLSVPLAVLQVMTAAWLCLPLADCRCSPWGF
jgi:hypothetical protein